MNRPPARKPFHRDFLDELRRGDPLFWIVLALVALFAFLGWLIP